MCKFADVLTGDVQCAYRDIIRYHILTATLLRVKLSCPIVLLDPEDGIAIVQDVCNHLPFGATY